MPSETSGPKPLPHLIGGCTLEMLSKRKVAGGILCSHNFDFSVRNRKRESFRTKNTCIIELTAEKLRHPIS